MKAFESRSKKLNALAIIGGVIVILLSFGLILSSLAETHTDEDRRRLLEWRLPAEQEYRQIEYEFREKRKFLEREYVRQPKELEKKKNQLRQEEERLLQHVMDQHGLSRYGFLTVPPSLDDEYVKLSLMAEDPEYYRGSRIRHLKMEIQGHEQGYTFSEKLLSNRSAALQELRQRFQKSQKFKFLDSYDSFSGEQGELAIKKIEQLTPEEIKENLARIAKATKKLTKELANLEHEEARWQFPWPQEEEETFSELTIAWWEVKKTFLEQYDELSTSSPSYPRDRWDLTQGYRSTLRQLMRTHQIQPAHVDEYFERAPHFLQSYLQQHGQQRKQAKKIEASLKKEGYVLALGQAEGMGLIIGTVIQRGEFTEKGKGDNPQQRVPIAGIPIELVTQGDTAHKPQGFFWRTTSNAQGQFAIPAVPPGNYYLNIMFTQREKSILYRAPIREFFVGGNQEVLILDMLVEKVKVTIRSVPPGGSTP